ncbi:hypothetical protein C8J31_1206 [Rhizobium sp. PP-CC-2G-626]|nr:hypothetical protein C8J31_1206 [Rhizobium sp. PP-CC-2G-626]
MIREYSVTWIAAAGVLRALVEGVCNILSTFLVFTALILLVLPIVGIPLSLVLTAAAYMLGLSMEMFYDALMLFLGGIQRSLPGLIALIVIVLATSLLRWLFNRRHGWIGLVVMLTGSVVCLLFFLSSFVGLHTPFGMLADLGLAVLLSPMVLLSAVTSVFPSITENGFEEGQGFWMIGSTDAGNITAMLAFLPISFLFFYSLLLAPLPLVAGLLTSDIYRASLGPSLTLRVEGGRRRRFRIIPHGKDLTAALIALLFGVAGAVVFGVLTIGLFYLLFRTAAASGFVGHIVVSIMHLLGPEYAGKGWDVPLFLLAAFFLAGICCLALRLPAQTRYLVPSGALIECIGICLLSTIVLLALATTGSVGDWPTNFYIGLPLLATLLFARNILWRVLLATRERLLSGQQRTLDEVIEAGEISPILYLRAFKDDHLTIGRGFRLLDLLMGTPSASRRFEELIASRGFNWRPIVALGNPHLPLNLHGVLKKAVSDETWQDEVIHWQSQSAYTVMISNKTENLAWEIELIKRTRGTSSAIFIVTSVARARTFFEHYEIIDGSPSIPAHTLAVFRDPQHGWIALTSRLRSEVAYSIALDIAFARTESKIHHVGLTVREMTSAAGAMGVEDDAPTALL